MTKLSDRKIRWIIREKIKEVLSTNDIALLQNVRKGKWLIAYLDDASRFIVGYGIFDEATTENAISILDDCINRYGKPLELLTDHGSQFYANFGEIKAAGICNRLL